MAFEGQAPCATKSPAPRVFTMQDKWVLSFHKERFQLPVLNQICETVDNINLFYVSSNKFCIARVSSLVAYIRNASKTGKQGGSTGAANEETKQYYCKYYSNILEILLTVTG